MPMGPGENSALCNAIGDKLGAEFVVLLVCKNDELVFDVAMRPGIEPLEIIASLRKVLEGLEKEHGN